MNLNSQCERGPDSFPYTGRKDSAEGTLSISDALRVFSIRTLVAAKGDEANQRLLGEIVRRRRSEFLSTDFIFWVLARIVLETGYGSRPTRNQRGCGSTAE